ncbi:hypothetical protein FLONG3_9738 [Fusarium longipes]|uniref:Mid2 domain-containing protein n=1 Tax=Fusarium longipes TaxID=694270 RepID=A0A395RV19_9HYPO|nr:hypothetical protein FLONG3_9738 [Fusarium longipes]
MSSCYGSDKNENLKLFACDPDGDLKSCCSPGDSCASNGLCVSPNDDVLSPYFINGCTDENWDDPTCLKQCDGNGNGVVPCGTGKFCCYGFGGCDCNNSTQVFTLDPVKIVTTIPTDASRVDEKTSTTISDAPTATGSSSERPTVTHTNTSAADSATSSSEASSSNNALPIGLGVGIGAGVLLIGLGVGFWLWRRKKRASTKPAVVSDDYMVKPPVDTASTSGYGHYQPVKPVEMSANTDRVELP